MSTQRWARRRHTFLIFAALIFIVLLFSRHGVTQSPQIPVDFERHISSPNQGFGPLKVNDASALCRVSGLKPHPRSYNRRVYDLFLFSTELDWLDIRLNTLGQYVDFFVIVESRTTFTGLEKPLYLQDNWERFADFHRQIIYRIVDDPGASLSTWTWDHEDFMRNALFTHTFPNLAGTDQEAHVGDVLIISDIDELPKPATILVLRACDTPVRLTLRSSFYYYSFQWRHRGEQWPHPQATVFRGLGATISPGDLRNGLGGPWPLISPFQRWWQKAELFDAAWHCSSCFATLKEVRTKMESFSHTPWNTAENRDPQTITERVRTGRDLFGRETEDYGRVENNKDVPQYVLQNGEMWRYLLDRDGEHAGFIDWKDWLKDGES